MNDNTDRTGLDRRDLIDGEGGDAAAIARRAEAFARELGAVGDVGWLLAKRAAVLADRMERLAERDGLLAGMHVQAAQAAFDADRRSERSRRLADLDAGDAEQVAAALAALELSPEGLNALRRLWDSALKAIRSEDPAVAAGPAARARRLLDAAGIGAPEGAPALAGAVEAELARLRRRDERMRPAMERVLADARREVGVVAAFDPSPEARLARKHEAAAERGFFRALKLMHDLRRDAGLADVASAEAWAPLPGPAFAPRVQPQAVDRTARPAAVAPPAELGSFRIGFDLPGVADEPGPLGSFRVGATPGVEAGRRRRPDLGKVGKRR